jgi:WD40 repeat protein
MYPSSSSLRGAEEKRIHNEQGNIKFGLEVMIGPMLASCGDDGVRVWDADGTAVPVPGGKDISSSSGARLSAPATAIRWFPSGKLLTATTRAGGISFYHHETLAFLSEIRAPPRDASTLPGSQVLSSSQASLTAIDVSNGSRFLATGSSDGVLAVWDMKSRTIESQFQESASITAVSFQRTSDSRYVACASDSGISLYSRISGRLVNRFVVSSPQESRPGSVLITTMAFSPILINVLVAADNYGNVTVWDISRAKPLAPGINIPESAAHNTPIIARLPSQGDSPASDIAFCPRSGPFSFGVTYLDKRIVLYSLETRKAIHVIFCSSPLTAFAFSIDGSTIAAGTAVGSILTYRLDFHDGRPTHKSLVCIENAHGPSSQHDFPSSNSAVRSLHFQPTQNPSPPSNLKTKPTVTQALGSPSIMAVAHPSTAGDAEDPKDKPRESKLFSPLPKAPSSISSQFLRDSLVPRIRASRESDIIPAPVRDRNQLASDIVTTEGTFLATSLGERASSGGNLSFNSIASSTSDVEPLLFVDIEFDPVDCKSVHEKGQHIHHSNASSKGTEEQITSAVSFQRPPIGNSNRSTHEINQSIGENIAMTIPRCSSSAGQSLQVAEAFFPDGAELLQGSSTVSDDAIPLMSKAKWNVSLESQHGQSTGGLPRFHAGRMNRSTSEIEQAQRRENDFLPRSLSADSRLAVQLPNSGDILNKNVVSCSVSHDIGHTESSDADGRNASTIAVFAQLDGMGSTPKFDEVELKVESLPAPDIDEKSLYIDEHPLTQDIASHRVGGVDISHGRLNDSVDNQTLDTRANGYPEKLIEDLKNMFRQEMNAFREDVRSDLLNLHRELVLSFTHQEEHFRELLNERDKKLESLEQALKEIHDETKVADACNKPILPEWM